MYHEGTGLDLWCCFPTIGPVEFPTFENISPITNLVFTLSTGHQRYYQGYAWCRRVETGTHGPSDLKPPTIIVSFCLFHRRTTVEDSYKNPPAREFLARATLFFLCLLFFLHVPWPLTSYSDRQVFRISNRKFLLCSSGRHPCCRKLSRADSNTGPYHLAPRPRATQPLHVWSSGCPLCE